MTVTQWIIVGMVAFLIVDFVVYFRWVRRAKAARDRGESPPRLRWPL
jgi:hypothetical protein